MPISDLSQRLALHTWTIDTTPLPAALAAAHAGGWDAMELRRIDFTRCYETGLSNEQVLDIVKASGMKVAVLGTEYGLLFAEGDERKRLFDVFTQTCSNAVSMGCPMIMTAPGQNVGTLAQAALSLREAAQIAADHGLRLALEFNSQHDVINRLEIARDLIARAGHPAAGLLLDAYHLQRSGAPGRGFEHVAPEEIFTFQFSDVPPGGPPGQRRPTDRLPPGQGIVQWQAVFGLLKEKGYQGYISYEAPNPLLWARPPEDVTREGAVATRALLATC
jgi:sugar phosphate isomerase/epimerase